MLYLFIIYTLVLFLELNYFMFFYYIYLNIKLGHSDYCFDLDETMFLKLTQSR
jgi:hypothetical protein